MTLRGGLATLLLVAAATAAEAAAFVLDDRGIEDAVLLGESSISRERVDDEWRQRNGAGHVLIVMTPFHRVALAARDAAFREEPLKPRDRRRIAKEHRERLVLWLELRGPRADFARFYSARLTFGARQIEPAFVQNEHTAARTEDGSYRAHCVYAFPTRAITGTSRVGLLVRDGEGQPVTSFSIDLSTMR